MMETNTPSSPQADSVAPQPPTVAQPAARRAPVLPLLLSLLAIVGVALLGFVFLQQRQAMETMAGSAYALQQRSAGIEQQLAAAEAERERVAQQVQALLEASRNDPAQAEFEALRQELDSLRLDVATRVADSEHDWLLVEAATLLRLAQQQALYGRNVASAISLYVSADQRLQRTADAALQPVRAALQLELDALRAVTVPDVQGLYLQLGQLARQLAVLDVQTEGEGPLQFVAPGLEPLPASAGWWDEFTHTLGQYFVVTRRDVPVLARLTPHQAALIRQAIILQLESARLALLQGDRTLYQAAIDAAAEGITQQLQGEGKAALLASLQRLRAEPVSTVLPTLGAALQALELQQRTLRQQGEAATP